MKRKNEETKEQRKRTVFHLLCGTVLLFLAVVLSVHGVRRMMEHRIFSGIIGILGAVLLVIFTAVLLSGLIKAGIDKWKKK